MQKSQDELERIQIRAEQVLICLHLMDGKSREAERSGSILLGIGRIGSLRARFGRKCAKAVTSSAYVRVNTER